MRINDKIRIILSASFTVWSMGIVENNDNNAEWYVLSLLCAWDLRYPKIKIPSQKRFEKMKKIITNIQSFNENGNAFKSIIKNWKAFSLCWPHHFHFQFTSENPLSISSVHGSPVFWTITTSDYMTTATPTLTDDNGVG